MLEKESHENFMRMAIERANKGMTGNEGGPFGAVVVRNGEIVGIGNNKVTSTNDPTAHAEVVAIRDACRNLGSFQLDDCVIYTSCEPCPMCLGAVYWARPKAVYYACSKEDAANIGFDDQFIYEELDLAISSRKMPLKQMLRDEAKLVFDNWQNKQDKTDY